MQEALTSTVSKSSWIPGLEIDLGGPRRRQAQRYSRDFGQRHCAQSLPGRTDPIPRRHDDLPPRLVLRSLGTKQQRVRSSQSFVAGPAPKWYLQVMVKDLGKYAATGGWGFAQFTRTARLPKWLRFKRASLAMHRSKAVTWSSRTMHRRTDARREKNGRQHVSSVELFGDNQRTN